MNDHVKNLPVSELDELCAAGWELLDVRTPEEWDEIHAAGATHIPLDQLPARTEELGDRVVCLCAVGGRSAQAAQYLAGTGRQVANLDGGIAALQEQNHPILAAS